MYISEDDVQDKSFKIEIIFLEMLNVTNADLIDDCWSENDGCKRKLRKSGNDRKV